MYFSLGPGAPKRSLFILMLTTITSELPVRALGGIQFFHTKVFLLSYLKLLSPICNI